MNVIFKLYLAIVKSHLKFIFNIESRLNECYM